MAAPQPRIVGGEAVDAQSDFPFIVALLDRSKLRYGWRYAHTCGGALLPHGWAVTAAHCFVASRAASDFVVLVGANDLNGALGGVVKTEQQLTEGRLTRPASAHQRHGLAAGDGHVELFKYRITRRVGKANVRKADATFGHFEGFVGGCRGQ